MLESITLDQSEISAEIDAYIHHVILGQSGVFDYGKKFEYEVVNNNLIKIYDGLLVNQGRFSRIVPGTYEEIRIENGETGKTRYDLLVSHFETDGPNETHDLRIIQGSENGEIPVAQNSDTFKGGLINEVPLYLIKIEGINISSVSKQFDIIHSLESSLHVISQGEGYIEVEFSK